MFSKISRALNAKKVTGQGMSEYLIIVGLIAVVGIATMGFMGSSVRSQLAGMAQELSGGDGSAARTAANTSANAASARAVTNRSLSNYTGNNQ